MQLVVCAGFEEQLQQGRGAYQSHADAGGQYTESNKIGQRVDLNAVVLFHSGAVLLGTGYLTVKGITQTTEQQEEGTPVGMTVSAQGNKDAGTRRK